MRAFCVCAAHLCAVHHFMHTMMIEFIKYTSSDLYKTAKCWLNNLQLVMCELTH